jgi:hypothetical protein
MSMRRESPAEEMQRAGGHFSPTSKPDPPTTSRKPVSILNLSRPNLWKSTSMDEEKRQRHP